MDLFNCSQFINELIESRQIESNEGQKMIQIIALIINMQCSDCLGNGHNINKCKSQKLLKDKFRSFGIEDEFHRSNQHQSQSYSKFIKQQQYFELQDDSSPTKSLYELALKLQCPFCGGKFHNISDCATKIKLDEMMKDNQVQFAWGSVKNTIKNINFQEMVKNREQKFDLKQTILRNEMQEVAKKMEQKNQILRQKKEDERNELLQRTQQLKSQLITVEQMKISKQQQRNTLINQSLLHQSQIKYFPFQSQQQQQQQQQQQYQLEPRSLIQSEIPSINSTPTKETLLLQAMQSKQSVQRPITQSQAKNSTYMIDEQFQQNQYQ